ncbi:hypothetical protein [Lysobacter terrae]
MTQRNNHPQTAIAKSHDSAALLRVGTARIGYVTLETLALITVLVLITGPASAEYGFV